MTEQQKQAALMWLHYKQLEGGVEVDGIKIAVEEIAKLVETLPVTADPLDQFPSEVAVEHKAEEQIGENQDD